MRPEPSASCSSGSGRRPRPTRRSSALVVGDVDRMTEERSLAEETRLSRTRRCSPAPPGRRDARRPPRRLSPQGVSATDRPRRREVAEDGEVVWSQESANRGDTRTRAPNRSVEPLDVTHRLDESAPQAPAARPAVITAGPQRNDGGVASRNAAADSGCGLPYAAPASVPTLRSAGRHEVPRRDRPRRRQNVSPRARSCARATAGASLPDRPRCGAGPSGSASPRTRAR